MIPKEKAIELIDKFKELYVTVKGCDDGGNPCIITTNMYSNAAKRCALLATEFARENPLNSKGYNAYLDNVKQELEKLEIEKKIENIPLLETNIADKRQQIPSVEKEIADKRNELDKLIKPIPN